MWVRALRSGEYKQTTRVLHNIQENAFCCLGVLCELAVQNKVCDKIDSGGVVTMYAYTSHNTLPHSVMNWADMKSIEGYFPIEINLPCLTKLNDDGKSFAEIADIIENNYKAL